MRPVPLCLTSIVLLAAFGSAGCGSVDGGAVAPAQREVLDGPTTILVPVPDGRLIAERDARLLLLDPRRPETEPVVIGPASDVGEVHAAVRVRDAVLVLASGGAFVLRDAAFVPSPLADALDGPIADAVMLPSPTGLGIGDLWIATDRSLYRVVDERAERFGLDEDLSEVQLAAVARPEGPALWVLLPDRLLEVWRDRSGNIRSARVVLPERPDAIASDATLTGWLAIDGRLHSIGADRRLVGHGFAVDRLLGSVESDVLWMFGPDGVRLHAGGLFYAVDGMTVADELVALTPDGALLVAGSTVTRHAPRRQARLDGPADGALLVTEERFEVVAEGAPAVEATIDGQPLELADARQIVVDPMALGDGAHELTVRIVYDDGTLPLEVRRRFSVVSSATWSEDIEPLYQAHCAACHGAEGPANTRLDAAEDWQNGFDVVLLNIEEGRMPLGRPPLTQAEIALVQAWAVSGFPE